MTQRDTVPDLMPAETGAMLCTSVSTAVAKVVQIQRQCVRTQVVLLYHSPAQEKGRCFHSYC